MKFLSILFYFMFTMALHAGYSKSDFTGYGSEDEETFEHLYGLHEEAIERILEDDPSRPLFVAKERIRERAIFVLKILKFLSEKERERRKWAEFALPREYQGFHSLFFAIYYSGYEAKPTQILYHLFEEHDRKHGDHKSMQNLSDRPMSTLAMSLERTAFEDFQEAYTPSLDWPLLRRRNAVVSLLELGPRANNRGLPSSVATTPEQSPRTRHPGLPSSVTGTPEQSPRARLASSLVGTPEQSPRGHIGGSD